MKGTRIDDRYVSAMYLIRRVASSSMQLGVLSDVHLEAAEEDAVGELLPRVVHRFNEELVLARMTGGHV